jgi:hypothetical protein
MERTLRLGALNVVTQPHSAPGYQRLIELVRNRRMAVRIRADRFGLFTFLTPSQKPRTAGAYAQGLIGTFTQINEDGDWINLATGKNAEHDDLQKIVIPRGLKPNPKYFRFRFYLKEHLFIYEMGNGGLRLTPLSAKALLDRQFSAETVIDRFGQVEVTCIPKRSHVDTILNDPTLRHIHLIIHAPNPDDGSAAERAIMNRLNRINAQRIETHVHAKKDNSIKPDKELRQSAHVAADNGIVNAIIIRDGRNFPISSSNQPFQHVHRYSTEVNTEEAEFGIACETVRHQLRNRR